MNTISLPRTLSMTLLVALAGCTGDGDGAEEASTQNAGSTTDGATSGEASSESMTTPGETTTTGSTSTGGDTEDTEDTQDTDTDGEQPGSDLGACLDLPEAMAAGWIPGSRGEPVAGTPEQLATAGAASWTNALRLLRDVHPSGTVAGSPISMMGGAALGYARHGAEVCDGGLLDIVGFGNEGDALHETFGALLAELGQRDLPAIDDPDAPTAAVELSLTPSVWSIGSESPLASVAPYGAAEHTLDGDDLSAMNTVINCAVEQRTHGILEDFVPGSIPGADTTALDMLISYVSAPWEAPLEDRSPIAFTTEAGSAVEVPALFGEVVFGYVFQDDDVVVMTLPMRGEQLETTFIMPKTEGLSAFLDASTVESLGELRASAAAAEFELGMPKVETSPAVADVLEPLGIECEPFTVRVLLQGAAVTIDADGIAAAGAGAAESWGSGTGSPAEFAVLLDRPYAFFIVDGPTDTVLFNGRFDG